MYYAVTNTSEKPTDSEYKEMDLVTELSNTKSISPSKLNTIKESNITKLSTLKKFKKEIEIVKNGTYYIFIKDDKNNIETEEVKVENIDETTPVCEFSNTEYVGLNKTVELTLTCTDPADITNEKILKEYFEVDNKISIEIGSSTKVEKGYSYLVTVTGKQEGISTLKLLSNKITDKVGNSNELVNKEIKVTNIEIEIYNIIKNLINVDDFSITDDFLDDLGIDSLSLTSIYSALNNYNLTMQDLYTYSNIKDLANYIKNENNCLNLQPELDDLENIIIPEFSNKFDLSTVLLTGVTGFLGSHILHDLLLNKTVEKIYCIVRNKIDLDGYSRLKNIIDYYYSSNDSLLNLIDEKVIVLNGDITKPDFNLEKDTYILLQKTVKTVINSAANVKHYAKPEQIKKDNIISIDNMIDFCGSNISLAHISTLSIAGFKSPNTLTDKIFDENTIYIKQEFNNNPYLISKFNAEIHILKAIETNDLNAKIFRLGNIMPRRSDGIFQPNASKNIFITALKTFIDLKIMPLDMLNLTLECSPVDDCATAILALMNDNSSCIYHILNDNEISFESIINILKEYEYDFTTVTMDDFIKQLNNVEDEYVKEYILSTNLNTFSQTKSLKLLKHQGFKWFDYNKNYINSLLEATKKIV